MGRVVRGLLAIICAVLATGCVGRVKDHGEFENLGLKLATTELPSGVYPPVSGSDLDAVTQRGQLVFAMERALRLAEHAMSKAGDPRAVAVLPLVEIDPGGNSGEVVFVRWPSPKEGAAPPPLTAQSAERWLLASIRLNPDSVIDVELLTGPVEEGSHHARRITSLVTAADALRDEAPGASFHLLDLYEVVPSERAKRNKTVARVYALSADGKGPDLEAVVDEIRKRGRKPPAVLSVGTTHPAGKGITDPIVVRSPNPEPLSVTRALLRGPAAGKVTVLTEGDRQWVVDARTGEIERAAQ